MWQRFLKEKFKTAILFVLNKTLPVDKVLFYNFNFEFRVEKNGITVVMISM